MLPSWYGQSWFLRITEPHKRKGRPKTRLRGGFGTVPPSPAAASPRSHLAAAAGMRHSQDGAQASGSGSLVSRARHAGKAAPGTRRCRERVGIAVVSVRVAAAAAEAAPAWAGGTGVSGLRGPRGGGGRGRPGQQGSPEGTLGFACAGCGGTPGPSLLSPPPRAHADCFPPSGPCRRLTAGPDPAEGPDHRHHGQEKQIGQEPEGQVLPLGQGDG